MSVRTDVVNLNVNVNGDKGKKELNELRKRAADLTAEMRNLKRGTAEYAAAVKELSQVNDRMATLRKAIGLTALSQRELNKELQRLNQIKNNLTPGTQEFKNIQKEIDAVGSRLKEVRTGMSGFKALWSGIGKEVKQFGLLAAGYLGFEFITGQISNILSGAGKISDKLADLQRVAGLSRTEVEGLYQSLRKIDTRTSARGLLDLAIIAGKLGVEKDNIAAFTKALDQLSVALGDELGDADTIATQIGKIINVYDQGAKITGERAQQIGNAIVDLGNKGVATGGFIVDFTQRLGGLANVAHISLGEAIGLAAGLEEMGLKSESATTAVQKAMSNLGADVPKFARIAGVSVEEFSETLRTKPVEALIQLSEGLVKDKNGFEEISKAFQNAGEDGARIVSTLATIGAKADFMRGKINLASADLKSTTYITEAFALKNETLGATLDKIGKRISAYFTSSALNNWLKSAAKGFAELIGAIDNTNEAFEAFNRQKKYVQDLDREVKPLIEDYDRLAKKAFELGSYTKLSREEQGQLQVAIQGIAKAIPGATTEFDKYGRAINVSTQYAQKFLDLQKAILKERNRDAIAEAEKTVADIQRQIQEQERKLAVAQQKAKSVGDPRAEFFSSTQYPAGKLGEDLRLRDQAMEAERWNKAITESSTRIAELQSRMAGQKGILAELRGEDPASLITGGTEQKGGGTKGVEKEIQTLEKLRKKLQELKDARDKIDITDTAALKKSLADITALEKQIADLEGKTQKKAAADEARAQKKAENEMQAAAQRLRKLQQQLVTTQQDLDAAYLSEDEKRIQAIADRYTKVIQKIDAELHGKKGNLLVKMGDYAALVAGFSQAEFDEFNLQLRKSQEERAKKGVSAFQRQVENADAQDQGAKNTGVANAQAKLAGARPGTLGELDAYKELLRARFRADVGYLNNQTAAYKEAQAKLNKDLAAADKAYLQHKIEEVGEILQGISGLFSTFTDAQNAKDDAQLARDRQANDAKKANFDRQLKAKQISQKQYDNSIAALDADMDRRQKEITARQAKRNKAAALFSAIINAALGITKIWAEYADVPYVAAALTAIEAAATGFQIAKIEESEVPKGRKGLVVSGSSHEAGGIAMVDNASGRQVAEIEGGEPVMVLSKDTYGNNKRLIDELIYNSQYRNGAAVSAAAWYGAPGPRVNAGKVITLMREGGVVSSAAAAGGGMAETNAIMQQLLEEQKALRAELAQQKKDMRAYVVLQDITDNQTLLAKAKSYAGIRQAA